MGFWAPGKLDRWAKSFEDAGQPHLVLTWSANCSACDAGGQQFYSLLVRVPSTMVVVELVATEANVSFVEYSTYGTLAKAPLQRVSGGTLAAFMNDAATDRLSPLKVRDRDRQRWRARDDGRRVRATSGGSG